MLSLTAKSDNETIEKYDAGVPGGISSIEWPPFADVMDRN